jgi:hypothetical protein
MSPAPKPVTKHNHPAPAMVWTDAELRWIAARDAAWQAALSEAVAAEREACAKACDDKAAMYEQAVNCAAEAAADACAAAIRARTGQ